MEDWWQSKMWRFIQTNLREIDMQDIRADQVVADMKAFHANVVMINAAGIIASYPTKLPYHFQSPFLTGDSLIDIITACHEENIRVMARTDFSKIRMPIYEDHPDWASVTAEGDIVEYNGDVQACVNAPYQQEFSLKIIEECLSTHEFDGIFFNMGGYKTSDYSGNVYGHCCCAHCDRRFREMFGEPLPRVLTTDSPATRKYRVFQRRTLAEHHAKVYKVIKGLRPGICVANHRSFNDGFNRQESNTGIDRALPHWQYSGSDNTKWAVCSHPDMVSSNTTVDFIDYPYRHVAVSPGQQALRLAQNLANGGALDYYLIGRLDNHADRSGFESIKRIYAYHEANESVYIGNKSIARVALIRGAGVDTNEFRGWFRVLVEHHHLFDSISAEVAVGTDFSRYQAVILPNLVSISDELAGRLDAFVAEGGTLIAVHQSGTRDGDGEPRETCALTSIGLRAITRHRDRVKSGYFAFDTKQGFDRFADTDLIFLDGPYLHADYSDHVQKRLQLIPPHMFGPPERCYYTQVTDHPGVTVATHGKGRAIHVPWLPGRLYHRQGYSNTAQFMADVLEGIAEVAPVSGTLPAQVEVTWFRKNDNSADLVHLVNASGHFGVSFLDPIPMSDLHFELPLDRQPARVRSLVSGQDLPFDTNSGTLTITVPRLDLFEAIQIS